MEDSGAPYSAFSASQKNWIIFIAASAGWFSAASSFIYFPAIPFLARDLHVDIEKINLTVTSYLVASGVFPTLVGSAADRYGRRPVFIVALGVYIAANIGLAVQHHFAILVVLRMVQSAAISGESTSTATEIQPAVESPV
jgi:MFS family permease